MIEYVSKEVCQILGVSRYSVSDTIQTLWSGYGQILRLTLHDGAVPSVIAKVIAPPDDAEHPRGWNTQHSHQRKLRSYQVEETWYRTRSERCDDACRVPDCYGVVTTKQLCVLLLEDLDASGFSLRHDWLDKEDVLVCLRWLAAFHARWLGDDASGLWPIGTYWHLGTRPDEFHAMANGPLKEAASTLDHRLNTCAYQTLVHGDAKVANFCFSPRGDVAAVDFQYIGRGVGIKDVVYFLGSCLDEHQCAQWEEELLAAYFSALRDALANRPDAASIDSEAVVEEWRNLYAIAWADFTRFLLGWMPDHRKLHRYSMSLVSRALSVLGSTPSDF